MSNEIQLLSEIEAVRKNPWMYIGSVCGDGAHHLLYEIVHNAVDEAMLGFCTKIQVRMGEDFCEVSDNGRGIPTELHATERVSSAEVALTRLHAGSKFDKKANRFTAGLHGVGLSCVNALSSELKAKIDRGGKRFEQTYERGKPKHALRETGVASTTGTAIFFRPDREIFKEFLGFNEKKCQDFLENLSYLNPGLEIDFHSKVSGETRVFRADSGVRGLISKYLGPRRALFEDPVEIRFDIESIKFHVAFQWTAESGSEVQSFVNCVHTVHGGTHVNAFCAGLLRAVNRVVTELGKSSWKGSAVEMDEAVDGLVAVIDCKVVHPNFEGQTKTRFTNAEVTLPIERAVSTQLLEYFHEHPKAASVVFDRIFETRNARIAAKRAADRIYLQHGRKEINEAVYKEQFGARSKNWHDSAVWITHKELLAKHAELCEVSDGAIALDVCCGSGVVGASFKHRVKKVVGLDLTPEMVKLASARLDEVHQGNVYNIPFPEASFDLVCTREVLHLLPWPERPVSEIFRVLKPGGQFIVGQILPFSEDDALWMYRVFKKKQPLIYNMFQEEDFRRLLMGAGFIDMYMEELNVWESIDVWIDSYETTGIHRHEIRELFRSAPEEAKAVHPFKILPNGEIQDLWRWCVFSVKKPAL